MTKLENLIKDLNKANKRLKEATSLKPTDIHKDATIQRFEFTFELSWKFVQEYIRDQGSDCKSPKSCIREGARLDIIKEPKKWFDYLKARNLVAHTYNQKIADNIYCQALKFPEKIDNLLKEIS